MITMVVTALTVGACGNDEEAAQPPAGGGGPAVTFTADPGGGLAYTEDAVTAQAGPATLTLVNDSPVPHNVVLERDGEDVATTDTVTGETTQEPAELEPGEYAFYCSIGSHRSAGMEGTLTAR